MTRSGRRRSFLSVALGCLTLALCAPIPAAAQPVAGPHVFGGVSILRDLGTEDVAATTYDRGWLAAAGVPLPWWGLDVAGEVGMNSRTNIVDETQRLSAVLGGVRMNLLRASRLTVFGQALAGIEWFSEPGFDESGPAFQPGAGVDVSIWSRLGARAQVDWRLSKQNGDSYKEVRLAVGVVVR
jgi:hypothetical protein